MSEKDIYFQTIHLTVTHPESGKEQTLQFVGKAIMTPDEIKAHKDVPIESIITAMEIDKPYNPYDDDTNDKAAQKALSMLREALKDTDTNG
jgi:hypothetical protein